MERLYGETRRLASFIYPQSQTLLPLDFCGTDLPFEGLHPLGYDSTNENNQCWVMLAEGMWHWGPDEISPFRF